MRIQWSPLYFNLKFTGRTARSTSGPLLAVLAGALFFALFGCAPVLEERSLDKPEVFLKDHHIGNDQTWSGRVIIDGQVKVGKNATLTILPGTEVSFVPRDADADGLGDAVLAVEGRLLALGTRRQPIKFHSASESPKPGDWLEIRVDFSREVHLRYCEIRDSAYTLHAHFTRGIVEDSHIHHNIDGCRLGQAQFTFRNNLIEHNEGKGINFRNAKVDVHHNILRFNGSGIFLFESDRPFTVRQNNIYANLDNFRLGDFYTGDVALRDNWWGSSDRNEAQQTIYDHSKDPELGKVTIAPAQEWVAGTGPRDALELTQAWQYATGGYIDADMVAQDGRLYVASWDGRMHVLDDQGRLLWTRDLNDTLDATPALDQIRLFVQTWSREVYALDRVNGHLLWRFDYSPSRADDHRQGGLLKVGDQVLVPAWNGTLFSLDAATGEKHWSFYGGQPLRSQPAFDGTRLYLASGGGTLSVLARDGTLLWQHDAQAPLLSTPTLLSNGVAVVDRKGRLQAFDSSGKLLWERALEEPCFYASAVYNDGALYIATAGSALWKLDAATGKPVWRTALSGPSYAKPLISDGRIFVGDNSGTLQVVGADSGDLLSRVKIDREIQTAPLTWSGLLLVGSRDHNVHAFSVIDQEAP